VDSNDCLASNIRQKRSIRGKGGTLRGTRNFTRKLSVQNPNEQEKNDGGRGDTLSSQITPVEVNSHKTDWNDGGKRNQHLGVNALKSLGSQRSSVKGEARQVHDCTRGLQKSRVAKFAY